LLSPIHYNLREMHKSVFFGITHMHVISRFMRMRFWGGLGNVHYNLSV